MGEVTALRWRDSIANCCKANGGKGCEVEESSCRYKAKSSESLNNAVGHLTGTLLEIHTSDKHNHRAGLYQKLRRQHRGCCLKVAV